MTEAEAATILLGREYGYKWDRRLLPLSCGAAMRDQAEGTDWLSDSELYNIAKGEQHTGLERTLAAKLYVSEKRLAFENFEK